MEKNIAKLYEMMKKINPDFKINEDSFPTFNTQQNTQQTTNQQNTNNTQQQNFTPKTGDGKTYNKVQNTAKNLNNKTSKINTAMEFPDAFKIWFSKLGYTPEKGNITIARVTSEIRKAMIQLGYK